MAKKRKKKSGSRRFKWVSAGPKVRIKTKSGVRKVRPVKKVRVATRK